MLMLLADSYSLFMWLLAWPLDGSPWQKHLLSICRSCVCPDAEQYGGLEAVEAWCRPSIQFPPFVEWKLTSWSIDELCSCCLSFLALNADAAKM